MAVRGRLDDREPEARTGSVVIARQNRSKARCPSAGSSPGPSSQTVTRARSSDRRTETVIAPPAGPCTWAFCNEVGDSPLERSTVAQGRLPGEVSYNVGIVAHEFCDQRVERHILRRRCCRFFPADCDQVTREPHQSVRPSCRSATSAGVAPWRAR